MLGIDSLKSFFANPRDIFSKNFCDGIQPDRVTTTPADWADEFRILSPKASSEPGQWKTSRVPYTKEPMESLGPRCRADTIVLMWGSQLAKTECGLNFTGFVIDVAPGPMLMVQPSEAMVKKVVRQRLDPAIEETPELRQKVSEAKGRDAANSLWTKDFPGGVLIMAGANAPANLASMPIRYLFMDEIDRYPGDVGGEGDPVQLAKARTRNFANRKTLLTSTPTEKGSSRIETAFEESDQRHYYVPCPHCDFMQTLKFGQLHYDHDEKGEPLPETTAYICEDCGAAIYNYQKRDMLDKGEWRAHKPEIKDTRGYFINSLYSPFESYSWSHIIKEFLAAKKKPSLLKTFVNTVLAQTWEEKGDAPDWEMMYRRREDYEKGTLPKGVLFLTAGVDIQHDRIEVEVKGWGRNHENWSIDYTVLKGDTTQTTVWDSLWAMLKQKWPHVDGGQLGLSMMGVDSSDRTQMVYDQCRKQSDPRVLAIKGRELSAVTVGQPKDADINYEGRKIYRGIKWWPVGVNLIKSELYGWWKQEMPIEGATPHGYSHWPEYDQEYFKQATAETKIKRVIGGRTFMQWVKKYERNEVLDTNVYARAAAYVFGLDRMTEENWKQLEFNLALSAAPAQIQTSKAPKKRGINPITGKKHWM